MNEQKRKTYGFSMTGKPLEKDKSFNQIGNFHEFSSGAGTNVIKANSEGFFIGGSSYTSAPFKVSYAGTMYATSGTIAGAFSVTGNITLGTGGYINRGKTSFESTVAGFWLDNRLHIGSSADKYFKYDGTDISMGGGTITGGVFRTDTTGYRTVISDDNIEFYNGDTKKGFLRPDSSASMVLGTADDIYFTNLSGTPTFKFSDSGNITLMDGGGDIKWDTHNVQFSASAGNIEASHTLTANGYVKTKDKFYVDSDGGDTGTFECASGTVYVSGGIIIGGLD